MNEWRDHVRIGFFGDHIWAQNALELFIKSSEFDVAFVVTRYEKPDEVMIRMAKNNNIPVLIEKNVNNINFIENIKKYNIDLNVSMSFDQIIKKELFTLAPKGFINCHAGSLPFYRGRNVLNWVLINGEKEFGITVHYIDEGIDTGDIILQKKESISINHTYDDLLKKSYRLCPELLYKAAEQILHNTVQTIPQSSIHPVGFYCGKRRAGDERIDWNWSSERIHNFIRAITYPGPYALTTYNGKKIKIAEGRLIEKAPCYIGTSGEVVGKVPDGVIIKTGDSTIKITGIVNERGEKKVPIFNIGSRFS